MLKKYAKYLIAGLFVFLLWVYLQGTIGKVLFDALVPVEIPQEFYRINRWLLQQKEEHKVIWLPPQFDARLLTWRPDYKVNDFVTISSQKPTLGPQASSAKFYFLFLEQALESNPHFSRFFDILNTQYIILRKDLPEDYSHTLLQNLRADSELSEINLTKIDSQFFCYKALPDPEGKQDTPADFVARCGTEKERPSYLNVFRNNNFAPQIWIPQEVDLVIGGMEAWEILNSKENFNPQKEALIFATQETNLLSKISDLQWKNIIFNNANLQELCFSLIDKRYIVNLSALSQERVGEWRKASTQEPLHGEWHQVIDALKIPNWDFDFGQGLVYSERDTEKLTIPLPTGKAQKYFLVVRYFQSNQGGKFQLTLDGQVREIKTLNLNNKFVSQVFSLDLPPQDTRSLILQNKIGFNAVNLIALIPEKEYQTYQKTAQDLLEDNKILYLRKISREMMIEPLELDLPQEGDYEVLVKSKMEEPPAAPQTEQPKITKTTAPFPEKIINLEDIRREQAETTLYFGDKQYILDASPLQKINWFNLGERFFAQKEEIPIAQKIRPASILNADNLYILDQGNLVLKPPSAQTGQERTSVKIFNLAPKIEILQGKEVSERRGRLITDAIRVKEFQNFYLEYKFQGENLKGVDARVLFYGKDYHPIYQRTAFKTEYFMHDQTGDVEPRKFVHFFGAPQNTNYIKIEFKAEPNLEEESWFEISDLKLYHEDDLGVIESLILAQTRETPVPRQEKLEVNFQKKNATQYELTLPQTTEPFILAFAESYDPMWKLKEKTPQSYFHGIFRSLLAKDDPEKPHFPLYAVINGYYIDPQELKTQKLILEYEPQNWFEAGLMITLGALIMACALIILIRYAQHKGTKKI